MNGVINALVQVFSAYVTEFLPLQQTHSQRSTGSEDTHLQIHQDGSNCLPK